MNPSPAEPELEKQTGSNPSSNPSTPLRFTYASGSRPLDGYQIKRGVGRGGFGEVYFAVSDAGKEVALKLIRRNLDVEVRGVTQCLNLKHQNLVALYDIRNDEHDGRWVVMEYVSGESLEGAIDRHPNGMPIELAMSWFTGIAAGVAYLHDHGIVHRDLKPANIFLDQGFLDKGIVKIGDYGLSKFISCSRRSGQTESVGTVHYMAPEIANGRYGKEIDTYALGIILYEMLTGHVPFEGESVGEVLMKHLTAEPDLTVLDEPYREIVRGAMTKDPDTRIQSVAAMLGRLPEIQGAPRFNPPAEASSPVAAHIGELASAGGEPTNESTTGESTTGESTTGESTTDEEPILAAISATWREVEDRFHNSNVHPLIKGLFLFFFLLFAIETGIAWVSVLFTLGFTYLVYRAVRAIVILPGKIPSKGAPTTQAAPAASVASVASVASAQPVGKHVPTPNELASSPPVKQTKRQYARRHRQNWQQQINRHVTAKPVRDRATELVGSMIVAAVISSLLSLLGVAVVSDVFRLDLYLWMSIVATLGSWAVMIPTKLGEGRVEDQAPLRFGLLVAGVLVGIVACSAARMLDLDLPVSQEVGISPRDTLAGEILGASTDDSLFKHFRSGAVRIQIPATTAYFAFLFVVLRWWRQAEYARSNRVSVWSIIACTIAAFLMTFVWWFPQPLGAVLAGMIAFTTQLSSPWMPPSKRRELAEQGVV